jgi:hypothetical protein
MRFLPVETVYRVMVQTVKGKVSMSRGQSKLVPKVPSKYGIAHVDPFPEAV